MEAELFLSDELDTQDAECALVRDSHQQKKPPTVKSAGGFAILVRSQMLKSNLFPFRSREGGEFLYFTGYHRVGEKGAAALSFLERAINDIPTRRIRQQFLHRIDANTVLVNHFTQALDPLDITHRIIAPFSFSRWFDQTTLFIVSQCPLMDPEKFGRHSDGEN